jgi:hypothetical protein
MARNGAPSDVRHSPKSDVAPTSPGTYSAGEMADAGVVATTKGARAVEKLRNTAGVIAAVAGAITGMWTIYEKVKSDARQYTADSYETLAPQLNKLTDALHQIQEENQQLRQVLNQVPAVREKAVAVRAGRRPPPKATTPAGSAPTPENPPAAATTPTPPAPPATPGEAPPPPAAPPTAQATPPAAQPAANDPLGEIIGGAQKAREAVDTIRRVPESFEKVLEQRRK